MVRNIYKLVFLGFFSHEAAPVHRYTIRTKWYEINLCLQSRNFKLAIARTLVTLLRPWTRRFTMIISAWWHRTSSKFSGQEFEETHRSIRSVETPTQVWIPPITKQSLQAANSVDKNSKKPTGAFSQSKLLNRCGFLNTK